MPVSTIPTVALCVSLFEEMNIPRRYMNAFLITGCTVSLFMPWVPCGPNIMVPMFVEGYTASTAWLPRIICVILMSMYQYGSRSSLEFSQQLLRCRSLDAPLDCGFSILGNPIVVVDNDLKIVMATPPGLVRHPVYAELVQKRYFPVVYCTQDNAYAQWSVNDLPIVREADETTGRPKVVTKNLAINGQLVGFYRSLNLYGDCRSTRPISPNCWAICWLSSRLSHRIFPAAPPAERDSSSAIFWTVWICYPDLKWRSVPRSWKSA